MASIVQDTNVPSNNYLAEMLLKDVGGAFGDSGSTAGGIAVVQRFAAQQGARFAGENGSGLTRRNKASPKSVVKLLDSMIEVDEKTPPARRRISAAAGRGAVARWPSRADRDRGPPDAELPPWDAATSRPDAQGVSASRDTARGRGRRPRGHLRC
jgi:D-alanyl-D-alanine carboxypeptidase/D-alanyl-D-alanine-endopeptidase (penicillin-binding protein 4)